MRRRKNPWGLVLVPLVGVGTVVAWAAFGYLSWSLHRSMIPEDVILSRWTRLGGILMFVPPFFPALFLGVLFANGVAWCIPPLRRMFDGPPGNPRGSSFGRTMKVMAWLTLIALALTLPWSALGALNSFYVTSEGITYRPFFSGAHPYPWTDVRAVDVRCHAEGRNLHLNFRVEMKDGALIDLMQDGPVLFADAYDEIRTHLDAQPDIITRRRITQAGSRKLERSYPPDQVRRIRRVLTEEDKKP